MDRLEKLNKFLDEYIFDSDGDAVEVFATRNVVGDKTETIYEEDGITVEYCRDWGYIEILGLTDEEWKSLFMEEEDD